MWTNRRSADVVNSVLKGEFAAGVAEWNDVATTIEGGSLRLLKRLRSPNVIWVANTNLPPQIATAIKECLLDLRDLKVLGKVPGLTGFLEPRREDFDELERQMEKARQFDMPQLPSPK